VQRLTEIEGNFLRSFLLWNIWVGESASIILGFVEIGVFEKSCIEVALVDGCELQVGEGLKLGLNYAFTGQLG